VQGILNFIFVFLYVVVFLLIGFYIYQSITEIIVVVRHYNFKRAYKCNPNNCGFFKFEEGGEKDCLNPFISKKFFSQLSQNLDKRGCLRSLQIRESKDKRISAENYRIEYLAVINSFDIYKSIWKVIALFAGLLILSIDQSKVDIILGGLLK
jgi:hypothetical protein